MIKAKAPSLPQRACAASLIGAGLLIGQAVLADQGSKTFPDLPLPPVIEGLVGIPQTYTQARSSYLSIIHREATARGLPPALADAVVKVESGFNAYVVGGVGEVGLMQLRPETAAMLGYQGGVSGLFDPETNIRFGVTYLARAWQLANGDLCRALMKYRAGWGEERMTPLSVEYCRRAREHLASIGSPLANGASPLLQGDLPSFAVQGKTTLAQRSGLASRAREQAGPTSPIRLASLGSGVSLSSETRQHLRPVAPRFERELRLARIQAHSRNQPRTAADSSRFWAAHEERILALAARRNGPPLRPPRR